MPDKELQRIVSPENQLDIEAKNDIGIDFTKD